MKPLPRLRAIARLFFEPLVFLGILAYAIWQIAFGPEAPNYDDDRTP